MTEVLDISDGRNRAKFIAGYKDSKEDEEVYTLKDINNLIDFHEHYENTFDRIDLFYGKERVYITFRKSRETRRKFAKFILKTKEWVKIKRVKENKKFIS